MGLVVLEVDGDCKHYRTFLFDNPNHILGVVVCVGNGAPIPLTFVRIRTTSAKPPTKRMACAMEGPSREEGIVGFMQYRYTVEFRSTCNWYVPTDHFCCCESAEGRGDLSGY